MSGQSNGGRLTGRRILITGAASGIGRATSILFSREGARLALLDKNEKGLEEVAALTGGVPIIADLMDDAAIAPAVEQAADAVGGLDGLVNAAGVQDAAPLGDLTRDRWGAVMQINLTAPYMISRAAVKYMQGQRSASVVNISSGQGVLPNAPNATAYAASKAGLIGFTKAFAAEFAPGIRANAICPGIVDTPMTRFILEGYPSRDDAPFVQQYALKRVADADELAEAILFLISDASSFITGITLAVDGGRTFH